MRRPVVRPEQQESQASVRSEQAIRAGRLRARAGKCRGSSLGWGVSIGRFVMWNVVTSGIPYLNFILMLISGIMTGTDAEKRALHDRVCDTRVVYKQSMA